MFHKRNFKVVHSIKYVFLLSLMLMLSLSTGACRKSKEPEKSDTPMATEPEEKTTNPLGLTGYEFYEKESSLDEAGDVALIASVEAIAKVGENYLSGITILSHDEDTILVSYSLIDKKPNSQEEAMGELKAEHHLSLFSADTLKLIKDVKFDDFVSVQRGKECFIVEIYEDAMTTIRTYDNDLNEIGKLELSENVRGICSPDGKRIYYDSNSKLYVHDVIKDMSQELVVYDPFLVEYISGVLTDEAGTDYIVFDGVAADYNQYQFILNGTTGQVVRVEDMVNKYTTISGNAYIEYTFGDTYMTSWLTGISPNKAYDYNWSGDSVDMLFHMLENGDILFVYEKDNFLHMYLYDYTTANLLGATSFDVTQFQTPAEEMPGYEGEFAGEDMYMMDVHVYEAPVYRDDSTLLFSLSNIAGERYFLEWEIAVEEEDAQQMIVTEHAMGSNPSVDISTMDNILHVPGELSEEFEVLRIIADDMEKKYGVEIYIGQECGGILGGYAVVPSTDFYTTKYALESLDIEMSKYPENFFKQFAYSWLEGLDIYLTGDLIGTTDEALDYAGGVKTTEKNRVSLVVNCHEITMRSTFHHELFHAIDDKISYASSDADEEFFTEEKWNSFNPEGYTYTYTYDEFGYQQYNNLAYDTRQYEDGKVEETYFVDHYSMTYPSEDRARIFESIMTEQRFNIDFEKALHLKEKRDYLVQCIQKAFDTTGWNNVMWEND